MTVSKYIKSNKKCYEIYEVRIVPKTLRFLGTLFYFVLILPQTHILTIFLKL